MANFESAFDYAIGNETFRKTDGSLSDVVTPEPGEAKARYGVNSLAHPKAVADGFYEMPAVQAQTYARNVFLNDYWLNRGFAAIQDQRIASKLFDMAINMGNGGELEVLQTALNVPVTHKMDAVTQTALSKIGSDFMSTLVNTLKAKYQRIANSNPEKYGRFLKNWLARADKVPQ